MKLHRITLRFALMALMFIVALAPAFSQTSGDYRSKAAGPASWGTVATWETYNGSAWVAASVVPAATNPVTIQAGHAVTLDATGMLCKSLIVDGTLTYGSVAAGLTVSGDITVSSTGSFTAGASALITHTLSLTGSLTANGTFDMNTTAGVTMTFTGATNNTISGTSGTIDFYAITVSKGTAITNILEVTSAITMSAPSGTGTRLTLTNGTFKLSSASALTPYYGSQPICAATGRLWINNSSASVQCVGTGTNVGAGSPTVTGTLQVDAGAFAYGCGNNALQVDGTLIIGGASASVTIYGRVLMNTASIFTMTAGNFIVDPQAASALASTSHIFQFSSTSASAVNFTGGTLTITDPHSAASTGYALYLSAATGTYNFVGSTIQFGDGVSTTAGSTDGFDIFTGSVYPIGNVLVNNTATNASTRFVKLLGSIIIGGNLTINNAGGSEFQLVGSTLTLKGNLNNNGVFNSTTAPSLLTMAGTSPQNINGSGTEVWTTGTAGRLLNLTINNATGVSL
ncbi:MAG: hypothetical protein WCM76_16710, partial [Bacteroidota bacterium]